VLEARVRKLEQLLGSPALAEVEVTLTCLKALRRAVEEEAQRLEWYVRLGQQARKLLDELAPDPEDSMDIPSMGSLPGILASHAGSKPAPAASSGGIPPALAELLKGFGV